MPLICKWPFAGHERSNPSGESAYIRVSKVSKAIHWEANGLSDNPKELDAVTLQLPYQLGQETEAVYAKAS